MQRRVNIGVIGCGSIAQQMHLPYLGELFSRFQVRSVCDVSPTLAKHAAEKYDVKHWTTDHSALLQQDLDAVLVSVSIPAEDLILDVLRSGRDVFVEKPMAWSPQRARDIEQAVHSLGRILMVGYMKRYDPGYELGRNRISAMGDLKLVLAHDIAGPNALVISDVTTVVKADDVEPALREQGTRARAERTREAIGEADPRFQRAYALLLGLYSHDLSVLRGILGEPTKVRSCTVWHDGLHITGTLEYSQCPVMIETGLVSLKQFDERIEAFSDTESIKIAFPSPFLKNAPTIVHHTHMSGTALVEERITASYEEAFRREWLHFYTCVTERRTPDTNVTEARKDTELMAALIRRAVRDEVAAD